VSYFVLQHDVVSVTVSMYMLAVFTVLWYCWSGIGTTHDL